MSQESRFGEPIELPWWAFALALPPLLALFGGVLLDAPLWARGAVVVTSAATIYALARVAVRVESRSMQSVWASLILAVWFFCAATWVAAVVSVGH